MNVATHLARAGRVWRERPAIALGAAAWASYGQLAETAARLAGALRTRCRPGERVALAMRNSPAYLEILYGAWHAALGVVPINARLHRDEFAHILGESGARICFVDSGQAQVLAEAAALAGTGCEIVDVDRPSYAALQQADPIALAAVPGDALAWLFYTSGTTGTPKGAMLTHRNLLAMSHAFLADVEQIAPGDAIVHAAPLSHGSGLYVLPHVLAGACNVITESRGLDPAELFELFDRHRGVTVFAAPTMVKRLVDHGETHGAGAPGLKSIIYGGGPMYVADTRRACALLGPRLVQIYGQGESPMTITVLPRTDHAAAIQSGNDDKLRSVGYAQSVVEVRVAGDDDRDLPSGEVGEVLVRGDSVMAGYLDRPEASAETLRGGWLHTGDLGFFSDDGYLTLQDRSRDLIISGGANIYAREVEEVLLRHPRVSEVAVVGRAQREWGEEVVAFVVPRGDQPVDSAALNAFCLEHLARFKRPRAYLVVAALPKNNYGKVVKTELRERLRRDGSSGGLPGNG